MRSIDIFEFGTASGFADRTAAFSASQIGSGNLSTTLLIDGYDVGNYVERFQILMGTVTTLDIGGFTFTDWGGQSERVQIFGDTSAETIVGSVASDEIYGRGGSVRLYGGADNDTTYGGTGNDFHYVDSASDVVVEAAGQGTGDRVYSTGSYTLAAEAERLWTTDTAGTGALNLIGNEFGQAIYGNAGANLLAGGGGDDDIFGGNGSDSISGGSGNDTLRGGAGDDTFVFATAPGASNVDMITDFAVGADQIEMRVSVFSALSPGALAASAFTANLSGQATTAAQRIVYETDTGALWYDADGSGGGARQQFAELTAGLALTSADIFVV